MSAKTKPTKKQKFAKAAEAFGKVADALEGRTTAKHTPGPWTATGGYCPQVKAMKTTIAGVINARADAIGGQQLSEITANANLIATAPDFFDATNNILSEVLRILHGHQNIRGMDPDLHATLCFVRDECEAVIAKADGGTADEKKFKQAWRDMPGCVELDSLAMKTLDDLRSACLTQLDLIEEGQDGTEEDDPESIRRWLKKYGR